MARQPVTPRRAAEPSAGRKTPWPLFIALLGLIVIAAGALTLARPRGQTAAPGAAPGGSQVAQLAVDQEQIDFGNVQVGKVVKATFVLKNDGRAPLQILNQPQVRVVEGC
jgi:hypothetical protein